MSGPVLWEVFQDAAYFDLWCVRPIGEIRFGEGFHVQSRAEAYALIAALSAAPQPAPAVGEREAELVKAFEEANDSPKGQMEPWGWANKHGAVTRFSPDKWREIGHELTPLYTHPAPDAVKVEAVSIKPLKWSEYEREGSIDEWDANSGFDVYYNIHERMSGGYCVMCPNIEHDCETLEDAKAAAQSDFEARIRAALSTEGATT